MFIMPTKLPNMLLFNILHNLQTKLLHPIGRLLPNPNPDPKLPDLLKPNNKLHKQMYNMYNRLLLIFYISRMYTMFYYL